MTDFRRPIMAKIVPPWLRLVDPAFLTAFPALHDFADFTEDRFSKRHSKHQR